MRTRSWRGGERNWPHDGPAHQDHDGSRPWRTVAAVAAVISYRHAYELVRSHGDSGLTARLVPFTVDGSFLAASMLHARCQPTEPARTTTWRDGALVLGLSPPSVPTWRTASVTVPSVPWSAPGPHRHWPVRSNSS